MEVGQRKEFAEMALEKIVIDTRRKNELPFPSESEEVGQVEHGGTLAQEYEEMPLGVKLLDYETQKHMAKLKASSRLPTAIPFNATSTRSFEKKVKAHIKKVNEEIRIPSLKPKDAAVLPVYKAVEEINRLSLTLNEITREIPADTQDLTQVKILERALEENFPESLLESLAAVPENHSLEEEQGEEMKAHWKAFEVVDSIMDQEIEELAKLSGEHARVMDKIYIRIKRQGEIFRTKMESMQRSLQSYRHMTGSLNERIDNLTSKVDYFTEVLSTSSSERKRLEQELSSSTKALKEKNDKSSDLMATYFAEKTILNSELSIYKQQILNMQSDRENAVLSATKSLSSDLTVALSEWESMEQKLLILEHQVKKAQADSSENLVKLHKNATVQTDSVAGKDLNLADSASSSQTDLLNADESEIDIRSETTLGSWSLMYVSVGQNQSIQWVLSTIAAIYNDAIRNSNFIKFSAQDHTFKDFVRRWHFVRYGLPYVAETHLADLIISVHRIARTNKNVRLFGYFCGIWDSRSKIHNQQVTFILYAMQCLSRSKEVTCLFPDDGNFWIKPLEVYEVISEIFSTMNSTENVREFMIHYIEPLLDPIMEMYKSEDILLSIQSEWERQKNKMCGKLEAFYNFVVPEGQNMLSFDEFAVILGQISDLKSINATAVYDECRSLCLETKKMTLEIIEKAILKYGIGLWTLKSFPDVSPVKVNNQNWSRNKMPQKLTTNPLFNILDYILKSKLFDTSVADADELKVKLGKQSTIVEKIIETHDALIREYKDRVDAEQAWKKYRRFISQVHSGRKSNGYFWTRVSQIGPNDLKHQSLRVNESIMSSSDDAAQEEGSPSSFNMSSATSPDVSPDTSSAKRHGKKNTANFLMGNI